MYEQVVQTGEEILHVAHHRAVHGLETQLHLLKKKWVNFKEKISEAYSFLFFIIIEIFKQYNCFGYFKWCIFGVIL